METKDVLYYVVSGREVQYADEKYCCENTDLSTARIVYRLNKELGPHSGRREEGFQEYCYMASLKIGRTEA